MAFRFQEKEYPNISTLLTHLNEQYEKENERSNAHQQTMFHGCSFRDKYMKRRTKHHANQNHGKVNSNP